MEVQFNDILYRDNILIKAAAGCGKTETIVKILDKSDKKGKFLILTHTNAGVESLIKRIKKKCIPTERYNVQTIASYCSKYVIAFPKLAKVTNLEKYNDIYNGMIRLVRNKIILQIITNTYCGLLVDEYQDCSETQHKIIKAISSVLPCKIFGDNMQGIFDFDKTSKLVDWTTVEEDFEYIGNLEYPWRWNNGNLKLGKEIIKIRKCLEEGKEIVFSNLSGGIQYIKDDDKHSDLIKKAYNLLKEKGTNVILFSLPNESHNFARIMNGNYASQEECERKELMKFCENFNYSALNILNMAKKCFTGFNKEYKSIYDNISQKKYTAKLRKNKDVYDICIALEKEFNYQDALKLLKVIENNSNIKLFRKELWSELKRVIKEMVISADKNIIEVAHTIRNISYKKYDYKNTISRVLLVKGLEFDNVIVVNPENMDKKLFYVAISRAKNKLIIVSKEEKIRFI